MNLPASETCKVETSRSAKTLTLRFSGQITESFDFDPILNNAADLAGVDQVVFDVGEVDRISSHGARGWLIFLKRVRALVPIRFSVVSEAFIEQTATLPGILGARGTPVEALAVPYVCPKCKSRVVKVIRAATLAVRSGCFSPPEETCPTCHGPLEFDAIESEYVSFLAYTARI